MSTIAREVFISFFLCRWNKVLRPGLHKGPWTEEEDSIVRECVELSGAQKVCMRFT